jgi:hypothetical protein
LSSYANIFSLTLFEVRFGTLVRPHQTDPVAQGFIRNLYKGPTQTSLLVDEKKTSRVETTWLRCYQINLRHDAFDTANNYDITVTAVTIIVCRVSGIKSKYLNFEDSGGE